MNQNTNALNWFDIPVENMNRAKTFYETIFKIEMPVNDMMEMKMAFFPFEMANGKVSGGLVESKMRKPGDSGAIIYLNADPDLQQILDRVGPAGGKILMPKTQVTPEIGFMAMFEDTEGNQQGLHSNG